MNSIKKSELWTILALALVVVFSLSLLTNLPNFERTKVNLVKSTQMNLIHLSYDYNCYSGVLKVGATMNGKPLSDSHIYLLPTPNELVTNENGSVMFGGVSTGTYILTAKKSYYSSDTVPLNLNSCEESPQKDVMASGKGNNDSSNLNDSGSKTNNSNNSDANSNKSAKSNSNNENNGTDEMAGNNSSWNNKFSFSRLLSLNGIYSALPVIFLILLALFALYDRNNRHNKGNNHNKNVKK